MRSKHKTAWLHRLLLAIAAAGLISVQASAQPAPVLALPPAPDAAAKSISVASFNIQFLGLFKDRDNEGLAALLAPYDLVFVQELVAPPYTGRFPDNTDFKPDPEARAFFDAMNAQGFAYVLSPEDTGTGPKNHLNSSATEWFVAFYKPGVVEPADDLPHGFLAADRSDNPDFERVPYAFGFRAGSEDLVFISVHLQPGDGANDTARRAHELKTIFQWTAAQGVAEHDYVVLGDMNIENCTELRAVLPPRFASLNEQCLPTNTNPNGPKPYDHVMFSLDYTREEIATDFTVVDLAAAMRPRWDGPGPYPGAPYVHDAFRQRFSDHNPVAFHLVVDGLDDD